MGFDSPSSGGGGGGSSGGMTLLDQGVMTVAAGNSNYVNVGIADGTRNLFANATSENDPTELRRFERTKDTPETNGLACIVQYSPNSGEWSVRIATGSNVSGDFHWYVYELPTG